MVYHKNRYLLLEVLGETHELQNDGIFKGEFFLEELYKSYTVNFGDHGLGEIQHLLHIKYIAANTGTILLECPRKQVCNIWSTLTLMTDLWMHKIAIIVL